MIYIFSVLRKKRIKYIIMNRIKVMLSAALLLFAGSSMAQKLSVENITIPVNSKANLVVAYESENAMTGAQFNISLPTGISLEYDEDSYDYVYSTPQKGYNVNVNPYNEYSTVILTRKNNSVGALTSGTDLIKLSLVVSGDVAAGEYKGKISGISFAQNGISVDGNDDFEFVIQVTDVTDVAVPKLSAENITIPVNSKANLVVAYESENAMTGAQFNISLPTGISLEYDEDSYDYVYSTPQKGYNVNVNPYNEYSTVILTRKNNSVGALTSGTDLIKLSLVVSGDVAAGEYKGKISGISFAQNGISVDGNDDFEFVIQVTDATGINDVNVSGIQADGKFVKNGQIVIKKGGKEYTIFGTSTK